MFGKSKSDDAVIPVVEEQLEVSRRIVETGAVRVRKHVDEVPVETQDAVVSERVEAERVPIGRVLEQPATVRHEGDVLIVPVMEERLVTRKELVLVAEIRITRHKEVQESPKQQMTVRRERVVVERLDPATQQWLPEEGS